MSDPLGNRTERPQPVEAAAADDEQVGTRRGGDQRGNWFVRQFVALSVDDQVDQPSVEGLTAVGDDRP
jgi:hypothetical protein